MMACEETVSSEYTRIYLGPSDRNVFIIRWTYSFVLHFFGHPDRHYIIERLIYNRKCIFLDGWVEGNLVCDAQHGNNRKTQVSIILTLRLRLFSPPLDCLLWSKFVKDTAILEIFPLWLGSLFFHTEKTKVNQYESLLTTKVQPAT